MTPCPGEEDPPRIEKSVVSSLALKGCPIKGAPELLFTELSSGCNVSSQHLWSASYLCFLLLALFTFNLRVTLEVASIIISTLLDRE